MHVKNTAIPANVAEAESENAILVCDSLGILQKCPKKSRKFARNKDYFVDIFWDMQWDGEDLGGK